MIRITEQSNIKCLKCKAVVEKIVRIGAIYMCAGCFIEEFDEGSTCHSFSPDSELGKIYYKWLKIYNRETEDYYYDNN